MENKKRYNAWLYFMKKDDTSASCKVGEMLTSNEGGNTSNMLKDLSTQHEL